jgi:hypothetical protein
LRTAQASLTIATPCHDETSFSDEEARREEVRAVKITVGLIGIAVIVGAWIVSHHERYPSVETVLAPHYVLAMSALNRLQQKGNPVLKTGDAGFTELSEILKEDTQRSEPITEIKKVNTGHAVIEGASGIESQHFFDLKLSFREGEVLEKRFYDVKAGIQKTYLDSPWFTWDDSIFFAAGILITIVSVFL